MDLVLLENKSLLTLTQPNHPKYHSHIEKAGAKLLACKDAMSIHLHRLTPASPRN